MLYWSVASSRLITNSGARAFPPCIVFLFICLVCTLEPACRLACVCFFLLRESIYHIARLPPSLDSLASRATPLPTDLPQPARSRHPFAIIRIALLSIHTSQNLLIHAGEAADREHVRKNDAPNSLILPNPPNPFNPPTPSTSQPPNLPTPQFTPPPAPQPRQHSQTANHRTTQVHPPPQTFGQPQHITIKDILFSQTFLKTSASQN